MEIELFQDGGQIKVKMNVDHTMRTKCRSIATFHRPIHFHCSLPLSWYDWIGPDEYMEKIFLISPPCKIFIFVLTAVLQNYNSQIPQGKFACVA
jgi:hypothetical protein